MFPAAPALSILSTIYGMAAAPLLSGVALVQGGGLLWWQAGLAMMVAIFLFSRIAKMLIKLGGMAGIFLLMGGEWSTLVMYANQGLTWFESTFNLDLGSAGAAFNSIVARLKELMAGS